MAIAISNILFLLGEIGPKVIGESIVLAGITVEANVNAFSSRFW